MSENLDLVRSIFARWERGDFSSAEWAHPDIEFASPTGVESATLRGVDDMAHAWRETMSAWREIRTSAEEYRELDSQRLLVFYRFNASGKLSGMNIDPGWTRGAALFQLSGGKVRKLVLYMDRDRALADLGLEE